MYVYVRICMYVCICMICMYMYDMYICICMICIYMYDMYIYIYIYMFEGSLEVKLPTIWTNEKQRWEESEKRREEERKSEKRKSQKKEDPGEKVDICTYIYTYKYTYTYMRIECRLRTIVHSHIIRHSRIQCQRGISNWPLWLKTHCSTRTKNCHAEAAIRVKSSPKHLLQNQVPGHNRTGNLRFAIYIYIYIYTHILYIYIYTHAYMHIYTVYIYIHTIWICLFQVCMYLPRKGSLKVREEQVSDWFNLKMPWTSLNWEVRWIYTRPGPSMIG